MGKYASAYVSLMQDWVGKKESDNSHMDIINIYNNHRPLARNYKVKSTDSWCATTVSAASIKLGYTDIIPTECSCGKLIEKCQKLGIWVENENRTPKAGELIFYDWDDDGNGDCTGWPEHVGVVEAVAGGKITVIEGNYSNAVGRRVISVNGKNIRGYASPKFDKEPVVKKKSVAEIAKEVVNGKWGTGTVRKKRLEEAGYNYDEVQKIVNELLAPPKKPYSGAFPTLPSRGYFQLGDGYEALVSYKAQIKRLQSFLNWYLDTELVIDGQYGPATREVVMRFQKKTGLDIDGKFGSKTLAKAKNVTK